MGMFDTLLVKYPLPDPEVQDNEFQTKDLESFMEEYVITQDGRLKHQKYEYRAKERTPTGSWIDKLPWMERIDESLEEIDLNFHGMLNFYTSVEVGREKNENGLDNVKYKYYDYIGKFTDGKLVSVERIPDASQD